MANDVMRTSAALLYGVSSIALMLANKSLVSVYQFNFPWTVVMQQFACNIVVLIVLRATSVVTWKMATVADLREMLPLAVINCMNVVFGLSAMHGLNLPMLTTLRRISILLTALGEAWILHQRPSTAVMATIALMLLGAFVAALHDLAFDLQAYVLVMMANLATACYVVMIKRVKNRTGMDVFGLLFYNSLLCLPPCLLASLLVGEWPAMRLLVLEDRAGFAIVLVLSLLLATTMSLAVFWNTTVNSPLTQTGACAPHSLIAQSTAHHFGAPQSRAPSKTCSQCCSASSCSRTTRLTPSTSWASC